MHVSYSISPEVSPPYLDATLWIAIVLSVAFHVWGVGLLNTNEQLLDLSLDGASSQQIMSISLGRFGAPPALDPKQTVTTAAVRYAVPLKQPASDFLSKTPSSETTLSYVEAKPAAKMDTVAQQPVDVDAVIEPQLTPETHNQATDGQSEDQQSLTQDQPLASFVRKNPSFSRPPVAPSYPRLAIKRRWQGEVLVQAWVSAEGETKEVLLKRSSGFELLDESALAAVKKWHFQAYVDQGRRVASWVEVPVDFTLRR